MSLYPSYHSTRSYPGPDNMPKPKSVTGTFYPRNSTWAPVPFGKLNKKGKVSLIADVPPRKPRTKKRTSRSKSRADPREANLMTYQLNRLPPAMLMKKIEHARNSRFITRPLGETYDPEHIMTDNPNPKPPFPFLSRPMPPPFPLPFFDEYDIDDNSSNRSSRKSIPKMNSYARIFSKTKTQDKQDPDKLYQKVFGSRSGSAKLKTEEATSSKSKTPLQIPLAEQTRIWEHNLRKTDIDWEAEKLKAKLKSKAKFDFKTYVLSGVKKY